MTQNWWRADARLSRAALDAKPDTAASARRRADERLDDALKATFPASDPVALTGAPDTAVPEEAADK